MEVLFFFRHLPPEMLPLFDMPLWKRLLAGVVYGGITEELFMRLFLMSLVAWLLGKWWKTAEGRPTPGAFWAAMVAHMSAHVVMQIPGTMLLQSMK